MAIKRWNMPAGRDSAEALAAQTGLPVPVCAILYARGHGMPEAASAFYSGEGEIEPGHALADMDKAVRRIREAIEDSRRIAVYGGLAEIRDDVLTILTQDAEWPREINLVRAREDREHAQRRLREKTDDMELQYDQVRLRRALVQLEVGSYTLAEEDE